MVKKVFAGVLVLMFLIAPVFAVGGLMGSPSYVKHYEFKSEQDISAYRCRYDVFSMDYIDTLEDCNYLEDMTSDSGLDFDDADYVIEYGYSGQAMTHVFVLDVPDFNLDLKWFEIRYITLNRLDSNPKEVVLFVKNFETGEWEELNDVVLPSSTFGTVEKKIQYSSRWSDKEDYVEDGKMYFSVRDVSMDSFSYVNSDWFKAKLAFD